MLSPQAVARALAPLGAPNVNVEANWPVLAAALQWAGIDSTNCEIAAAATVAVECGSWVPIEEYGDWNYFLSEFHTAYEANYHGRGFIQLSWSYNYQHYGNELGIDLLGNPALALNVGTAAKVLALYFKEHGIQQMADMGNWLGTREAVNGGTNGWSTYIAAIDALVNLPEGNPVTKTSVRAVLKTEPTHTSPASVDAQGQKVTLGIGHVVTFTPDPTPGRYYLRQTTPHWAHVQVKGTPVHGWYLRDHLITSWGA